MGAEFTNLGAVGLAGAEAGERATVIVTGLARSGTSMAAQVLDTLGVKMGESWAPGVYEDKEFFYALRFYHHALRWKLTEARNESAAKWGFKLPLLQDCLHAGELAQFRAPRLVVMTRDLAAVCARTMISDRSETDAGALMRRLAAQQLALMDFVQACGCPVLMMSYEKFLAFPRHCILLLAEFCGLTPDGNRVDQAWATIEANNPDYIELFHARAA